VAGHLVCGGMGSIRVGHRRSISRPVGPGVTQRQAHRTQCGSPAARRRDIQACESQSGTLACHRCDIRGETAAQQQQPAVADRSNPGSSVAAPVGIVAEPAVDHLDRHRVIANRASSCLHCPGPGDENVGPLALATIPIVAKKHADHPDVATIPTMRTEDERSLVLRSMICPWPGTAAVTLRRLVAAPTAPSRRLVAPIVCSDIRLVLKPNRTAS